MIDKSFQLIRTNPLLTTNVKLVVSSNYDLYLESFDSNKELSNIKYKHFKINKNNYLEDQIPKFFDGMPPTLAFYSKFDNDTTISYDKYEYQYDDIYFAGSKNIEDQWHTEEFEYLAPLYIRKNNLPDAFIIMRVDDPVIYTNESTSFELDYTNKNNFRNEIINKWKCVKLFDLTYQSDIGFFLYNNINNNNRFPISPLNINFKSGVMSKWYGMDYNTGTYTEKHSYMDKKLSYDNPQFLFEKYITEGYKNNKIIYPHILNMKFLFDDTPATPSKLKKYSMNRYYGFYINDLEYVTSLTSYVTPPVRSNVYLSNNIFISGDTSTISWNDNISDYDIEPESVTPFTTDWDDNKQYHIYIQNNLYQILKTYKNNKYYYKVISNELLDSYWNSGQTNLHTININFDDDYNFIEPVDSNFKLDEYYNCSGNTDDVMYADLYLIQIDGMYHVLKNGSSVTYKDQDIYNTNKLMNRYYIQTDYAINSNSSYVEYWINGNNSEYYKKLYTSGTTTGDLPLTFPIYRVKFSDIKDFDFDRVNTKFSNFDYEKSEYVETQEDKLKAVEYRDISIDKQFKVERKGTTNQYKISNVSSEYLSSDELFEIKNGDLTEIWRKNPTICKWGASGSISHSDYPYKLNNTTISSDIYNKTTNPFLMTLNPTHKNLDYFYRIGNFYSGSTDNASYFKHQSTNIQSDYINSGNTNIGIGFNIKEYMTSSFDYFDFYFKNKMYYQDNNILYTKSYTKYSVFNNGNNFNPSETIFKGIKYKINALKNIITSNEKISKIIKNKNINYNDYKLSVILNDIYNTGSTYTMNGVIDLDGIIDKKNGISIFINDKYKNVVIVLNVIIPMYQDLASFNNLNVFDPFTCLYYTKTKYNNDISDNVSNKYNPYTITSHNFIESLNNPNYKKFGNLTDVENDIYSNYIKYYYIKEYDDIIYTGSTVINDFSNSTMDHIKGWRKKIPPVIITAEYPDKLKTIKNFYISEPVNGPQKNVLNVNLSQADLNEPLARKIINNPNDTKQYNILYRYSGSYEPIFEDLYLFNTSEFCYSLVTGTTNISGITNTTSAISSDESSNVKYHNPINGTTLHWVNKNNICNDEIYPQIIISDNIYYGNHEKYSLYLMSNFTFNIPPDSSITGIIVYINKKTNYNYKTASDPTVYVYTIDAELGLYIGGNQSDNLANIDDSDLPASNDRWPATSSFITYEYGNSATTWGLSDISADDINNNFQVYLRIKMRHYDIFQGVYQKSEVQCISAKIYYNYNGIEYTATSSSFIGNNYKFSDNYNDFGEVGELLYSKVNQDASILKLNNKTQKNIYPMVDQFGYSYSKRFIFKSPWDTDYYNKTTNTFK